MDVSMETKRDPTNEGGGRLEGALSLGSRHLLGNRRRKRKTTSFPESPLQFGLAPVEGAHLHNVTVSTWLNLQHIHICVTPGAKPGYGFCMLYILLVCGRLKLRQEVDQDWLLSTLVSLVNTSIKLKLNAEAEKVNEDLKDSKQREDYHRKTNP
ncbi:hypothetical protein FQA47_015205 [Oryzias melastigma]|uniref:Uncharacterized protein n=1 Tax=Oryzias melastigma TaxID=30732 RepID=A0A834BV12_ORYME|nr:hypothetical protein FQA47_015205 [Oryzias melastigma]